jgi:hypothetical protein
MRTRFSFNPSGEFLMDFCYVNLWSYENTVSLMAGGNMTEKLQYYFVKKRIKKILQRVSKTIYQQNNLEFDDILTSIQQRRHDIWEKLLSHIIIKQIAIWAPLDSSQTWDEKLNTVLSIFLEMIKENQDTNEEILNLKIEKIKLQAQMDLLVASAASNNKSGQFKQ